MCALVQLGNSSVEVVAYVATSLTKDLSGAQLGTMAGLSQALDV
jgi:hypothetical protein